MEMIKVLVQKWLKIYPMVRTYVDDTLRVVAFTFMLYGAIAAMVSYGTQQPVKIEPLSMLACMAVSIYMLWMEKTGRLHKEQNDAAGK
jgi:EamA domain-containing membrane protein RarD